jgi:hypothetical protein
MKRTWLLQRLQLLSYRIVPAINIQHAQRAIVYDKGSKNKSFPLMAFSHAPAGRTACYRRKSAKIDFAQPCFEERIKKPGLSLNHINDLPGDQCTPDLNNITWRPESVFDYCIVGTELLHPAQHGFKEIYLGVAKAVSHVLEQHAHLHHHIVERHFNYLTATCYFGPEPRLPGKLLNIIRMAFCKFCDKT